MFNDKKHYARIDKRRATLLGDLRLPEDQNARLYERVIYGSDYVMHTIFTDDDNMSEVLDAIELHPRIRKGITGVAYLYCGDYQRVYITYASKPSENKAPYYRVQLIPSNKGNDHD